MNIDIELYSVLFFHLIFCFIPILSWLLLLIDSLLMFYFLYTKHYVGVILVWALYIYVDFVLL
jgi:hypothetical protein